MVYVFVGQDNLSKETRLTALKRESIPPESEQFNVDILYGRDLSVKAFQERLLTLPVQAKKRLVVIRQAEGLRRDVREYMLAYCRKPAAHILLVLDVEFFDYKESTWKEILAKARVIRFKEELRLDSFTLGRLVAQKRTEQALKLLHQLLIQGHKSEMIFGGLRYVLEQAEGRQAQERKMSLALLVACDLEIKTGKLKPSVALEKLVVSLCSLGKTPH